MANNEAQWRRMSISSTTVLTTMMTMLMVMLMVSFLGGIEHVAGQQSCGTPDPNILYTAVYLEPEQREILIKAYPPIHRHIYAQHMTMIYQPCTAQLDDPTLTPWGEWVTLTVYGNQSDDQGQAVVVSPSPLVYSQNNFTHVTISCAPGIGPVYSNQMLQTEGYIPASYPFVSVVGRVAGCSPNNTWYFSNPSYSTSSSSSSSSTSSTAKSNLIKKNQ